ncbi:unnamed protein product [Vitrella brassicaformis CCMP3155]|uniref:JmjC domain-containing protein n=1 Tax=Vitrella brassicaformis (strain CCMP3155) TaxID=1169540 RepID=A0A0G4GPP0_VITBC|nr:unnamed protein product [Vitrella brassicaformis CCMP3155]|eukprot:CEM32257.1 unnamed protein product [Vitrella brassicaformis CCMP3155]
MSSSKTSSSTVRKAAEHLSRADTATVEPPSKRPRSSHPIGIRPLGNLLIDGGRNCRDAGLGMLKPLSDFAVCTVFEHLTCVELGRVARVSRSFYVFANHEELWMQRVTDDFRDGFQYHKDWRCTWLTMTHRKGVNSVAPASVRVPSFYSDWLFQRFHCASVPLKRRWLCTETIDRRDAAALSVGDSIREYETPNVPVIIRGVVDRWPAYGKWSREHLLKRAGHVKFTAGPVDMSLRDFFAYADANEDDNPLFIFDPKFADRAPFMADDYTPPQYFAEDMFALLPQRPNFRWLLIGNRRSGSKWHVDPNATSAWNGVIRGAKKWFMLPPGHVPPGVSPSRGGAEVTQPVSLVEWLLNFYDATQQADYGGVRPLEATVCAGELLFIPRGWWHAVLNLEDDTFAITQNFVSPRGLRATAKFLRFKPEQVSGVSEGRHAGLWMELEEALRTHRPELLADLSTGWQTDGTAAKAESARVDVSVNGEGAVDGRGGGDGGSSGGVVSVHPKLLAMFGTS